MIFALNEEQIKTIKNNTFPIKDNSGKDLIVLKKADLRLSGTDTIFTFNLEIRELINSPKIFGNKKAKNLMKLMLFEVLNNDMTSEIKLCKTQPEIQDVINKYGAKFLLLNATEDFNGDKKDATAHNVEGDYFTLSYIKDFLLPESTVNFFTLGVVLYNDLETYIQQENLKPEFIEKRILMSDPMLFPLVYSENGNEIITEYVNDLRLAKSLLKNDSEGYKLLENVNEKINLDNKIIKLLSERQLDLENDKYFSNIYYSKSENGNLSFIFTIDYKTLIENNSAYKKYIVKTKLIDEFTSQITLSSMKVFRREIIKTTNSNKVKIQAKNETLKCIVAGADLKNKPIFGQINSDKNVGIIREAAISYSPRDNSNIRTFDVTDLEVYTLKNGLYEYGVEINLADGFTHYLKSLIETSYKHIQNLNEYYKLTENIVRTKKQYSVSNVKAFLETKNSFGGQQTGDFLPNVVSSQEGLYDSVIGSFTKKFVKDYAFSDWKDKNTSAIAHFMGLLNLFAVDTASTLNGLNVNKTFISMLEPTSASAETILYFINTYEKFIKQLQRIVQNIKNNDIVITHWFENDFVDASEKMEHGYQFVQNEKKNGFSFVTVAQLESIVANNIAKYTKNNSLDDKILLENRYRFIGPRVIRTINKTINLDDTLQDTELISQFTFAETEVDIKRQNALGDYGNKVPVTQGGIYGMSTRQQEFNLRLSNIMEKFSISIPSTYNTPVKKVTDIKDYNDVRPVYNSTVDPAYLFLSLSKLIDNKNSSIIHKDKVTTFISLKLLLNKYKKNYKNIIPYQIVTLANNNSRLFNTEEEYLKSVDLHSIYLFFYNTIHQIEYLEYQPTKGSRFKKGSLNIKFENWIPLTAEKVRSVTEKYPILCRLKSFQDSNIFIDEWQQIKMPVYNKYFILSGKNSLLEFSIPKPNRFKNFSDSMRQIITEDKNARLQNVIKNLPEIKNLPNLDKQRFSPTNNRKLDVSLTPAAGLIKSFTEKEFNLPRGSLEKMSDNLKPINAEKMKNTDVPNAMKGSVAATPPFIKKTMDTNNKKQEPEKKNNPAPNKPKMNRM